MVDETGQAAEHLAGEARDRLIRDGLVTGMTYAAAGALANVSERTVRRLMEDEVFRRDVHLLRAERRTRLADGLTALGDDAVELLAELMQDENPAVRLRAVQTALTLGTRFHREVEISDRIDLLEQRLADRDSGEGSR